MNVKSFSYHTADVYSFRFDAFAGWAIFTVCDATGELSIQSDWGDWTYRWNIDALGNDNTLTQFLAEGNCDYLARKLCISVRRPSCKDTLKALRNRIVESRREREIDKHEARDYWIEAEEVAQRYSSYGADTAMHHISGEFYEFLEEPWEFFLTEYGAEFLRLRDQLLPLFVARLEKDSSYEQAEKQI